MKTEKEIQKLEKQKQEIEKKIELLKQKEDIIFDNGEIKIIKWEDKKFGDFKMPKGYEWADFFKFVELVINKKINPKIWESFVCKKPFKNQDYSLFRAILSNNSYWNVGNDNPEYSDEDGRAVIQKIKGDKS